MWSKTKTFPMSKKKKWNKEIAERNSAWGKPLPPTMGKDIPPGTWVSRYCLEWFAYYVMEPPICDENGVAKEITLIRPEFECNTIHERNKPSRDVCTFETYEECMKHRRERTTMTIHEKDGWYYESDPAHPGDFNFGICKEDHTGWEW